MANELKTLKGQNCYVIQTICKYNTCNDCKELHITDSKQNRGEKICSKDGKMNKKC